MVNQRPFAISIAGFDPSGGAGLLADIKCFEQHHVYGFGVCTALTVQTDTEFIGLEWIELEKIIAQLEPLVKKFKIKACKIGLIKDLYELEYLARYLKSSIPEIQIVVDPILAASAGYAFHDWENCMEEMKKVLTVIDLLTPNYLETVRICGQLKAEEAAKLWAHHCPILLKGGHNPTEPGTDYLYEGTQIYELKSEAILPHGKHGSGCVLSAAITANLSLGHSISASCLHAKTYIQQFLNSNKSPLGYHAP
jgi:hydroxymethylpyrimidine/phosphomethylpyrimidine kinase